MQRAGAPAQRDPVGATIGLNVLLYVQIPKGFFPQQDTGNLAGFGFSKSALCAATRLPTDYAALLPGASYGAVTTVTDPDTGASCMQTMYVDHNIGVSNWRLAWMFGVAAGQVAAQAWLRRSLM